MSYPRDEFDEVDEKTARRGTYRAVNADPAKSPKGAIPLVAAGVVGLLVGAAMYIYAPRTASPEYSAQKSASSSASARSSASATASASPSKTGLVDSISVGVFNASAPAGSASSAAALLSNYTVNETANYTGAAPATSVVYYAEGYQAQAQSIAAALDISQVRQATSAVPMGNHEVIVVLASDYTG